MRRGIALPNALQGVWADLPLNTARGAIQDLSYRALRYRGTADALLRHVVPRMPSPWVRELLVLALALLAQEDYAAYTVVDQAVEAAAHGQRGTAGFVNAVLRRYLRERATLETRLLDDESAQWNYPTWWIRAVRDAYPQRWAAILRAGNAPPPMTLRINQRRHTRSAGLAQLQAAGLDAMPSAISSSGVVLHRPVSVTQLPGFSLGDWSVQDAAAQCAAPLLQVSSGQRVLDACAAPGGKAAHLLELTDCDLLALDHDVQRLHRVQDNFQRLQLHGHCQVGDAAHPHDWWDGRPFDRILADVPCSASGIVRRHADIRWLRRPGDIAQLTTTAERILEALWSLLRPGGKLLFATCSIFPQEGEQQARRFAQRHPDAVALPAPAQWLPDDDSHAYPLTAASFSTDEQLAHTHDGFFYALFEKRA